MPTLYGWRERVSESKTEREKERERDRERDRDRETERERERETERETGGCRTVMKRVCGERLIELWDAQDNSILCLGQH